MKKLLIPILLIFSFNSFSCADLRGIEGHMMKSKAGSAALLMMSMNRLGYGVQANSWLNTNMISLIERRYGKRVAVKMMADELRKSFKRMESEKFLNAGRLAVIHRNGLGINPFGKSNTEIKAYRDEMSDAHGLRKVQVTSIFRNTLKKRKVIDAINVQNYNVTGQLLEFWFNHFNIQGQKARPYNTNYLGTLRRSMCGTFADMLKKTATHPGMMVYLDNVKNTKEIKKKGVVVSNLNENYGREIVELHTLGTGPVLRYDDKGNPVYAYYVGDRHKYDEVLEATKVLTGFNIDWKSGGFKFKPELHEPGKKYFPKMFGRKVVIGEGYNESLRFLNLLSGHWRTKRHICRKLGKAIFGFHPGVENVTKCAKAYGKRGNLKAMYTSYINSEFFWSRDYMLRGNKTPFEAVISSIRAMGGHLNTRRFSNDDLHTQASRIVTSVEQLGEDLYNVAEPTGIKYDSSILHSSTFIASRIDKVNKNMERHYNRLVLSHGSPFSPAKSLWYKNLNRHIADVKKKRGKAAAYNTVMYQVAPVFYPHTVYVLREPMIEKFDKPDMLDGEVDYVKSTLLRAVSSGAFLRK